MCFRLGLIDNDLSESFHFLRQVRNKFAHQTNVDNPDEKRLEKIYQQLQNEYMFQILFSSYSNNEEI